jgi:hypothetical protein
MNTLAKEIGRQISAKEILHFGKSSLGFLDFLSQFFNQGEEVARVSSRVERKRENWPYV